MILPGTTFLPVWLTNATSCTCAGVLAARPPKIEWDPSLLINSLYLVAILLAGALLIALVNRWRQQSARGLGASDQLAKYRALYEKGSISQEEFERLRALLGGQLRRQAKESAEKPAASGTATSVTAAPEPADASAPRQPSRPPEPPETGIRPT